MKALARTVTLFLIIIPMSISAHPMKGPKGKKGKNKGPQAVVESYYGKHKGKHQGKQKGSVVYINKKKKGKVVVVKKRGRRDRRARDRRVTLLMSGNSWVNQPTSVYVVRDFDDRSFRRLLRRLDNAHGPAKKLSMLAYATSSRMFTVRQARQILGKFYSQRVRLNALEMVRWSIVDRSNFHRLLRAFDGRRAKREAAFIISDV